MSGFGMVVAGAIGLRALAQWWLARLNEQEVRARASAVPEALRESVTEETYQRAAAYTLAKNRWDMVETALDAVCLCVVLFSGLLPWWWQHVGGWLGNSVWGQAGTLFLLGVALSAVSLPLEWHRQFRLEQAFGFNTMTGRLWLMDRGKALLVAALLGVPLLALLLKVGQVAGAAWWFWAWVALLGFQLLMLVVAPTWILPLFNRLTPLPDGPLRERLVALGQRTGFPARQLFVMDGSRRSRHSNAFFASVGRWRKIVLFDTLIQQLSEPELEAVLAHEIGHFKRGHILKMVVAGAAGSLAGFAALGWLAGQGWFYHAFGLPEGALAAALLLFALLAGVAGFWLSPLWNKLSRRHEYEADAFAARALCSAAPLVSALRKLNSANLSNFTPHPWYSAFYYSHPALMERVTALERQEEFMRL